MPEQPLSVFDGEDPNGTWTLRLTSSEFMEGSLDGWSLTLATTGERTATTDVTGRYVFAGLRPRRLRRARATPGRMVADHPRRAAFTPPPPPAASISADSISATDRPTRRRTVLTQVYVNGTSWTTDFKTICRVGTAPLSQFGFALRGGADQLLTLPWLGVNQLSIAFTDHVLINQSHLELRGGQRRQLPLLRVCLRPHRVHRDLDARTGHR